MTQRHMKYNPAFLSPDELVESFVVRYADLGLIIEIIRNNTGTSNSHVLVIGPRGVGKTTLVLRAVAEVAQRCGACRAVASDRFRRRQLRGLFSRRVLA